NIFWVFFRAKDLAEASKVLGAMIDYRTLGSFITVNYREIANPYFGNLFSIIILIIGILFALLLNNSKNKECKMKFDYFNFFEKILYLLLSFCFIQKVSTFLYFNF
ncbi:MAG: MBOAT family protein, partial [Fusobacteriaceae bacterium]